MNETKTSDAMRVEVYLDDGQEPVEVYEPPARFELDTEGLEDGRHTLKIVAIDKNGRRGMRIVPFQVHNGPAIAVDGLPENGEVRGIVGITLNAYGARDREWEVATAENPKPIPAWMWLLIIGLLVWATYYGIALWAPPSRYADTPTYGKIPAGTSSSSSSSSSASSAPSSSSTSPSSSAQSSEEFLKLGAKVYSDHCASCHQSDGKGVPGTFPPLAGNPEVTANDPTAQIQTILFGKEGVKIKGTSYTASMPAWKSRLSDKQIAAVINHERTSWGNNAPTVTPSQVAKVRKQGPPKKSSESSE